MSVEPSFPPPGRSPGSRGVQALARATTLSLTVARLRQFERFLANPDPEGSSTTVYSYRTAVATARPRGRAAGRARP